jgi:hypothetical protein
LSFGVKILGVAYFGIPQSSLVNSGVLRVFELLTLFYQIATLKGTLPIMPETPRKRGQPSKYTSKEEKSREDVMKRLYTSPIWLQ